MNASRSWGAATAMRALALGALLCAAQAHAQGMDELYEKAKAEKTVALYGAGPPEPYRRWIADFEKQYPGVTVVHTAGLSTTLNKKVDQQLSDGKMAVDVGIFQTIQDFVRWKRQGALLLYKPEGFDKFDPAFKDEDGAFTTVSVNMVTYAYNTQAVTVADVPKSALDFLKPMFAGRLITTDPADDDAALLTFKGIVDKYGWSFMDKYLAQKPRFVRDGHATVSNTIAAGEMWASFDSTSTTPRLIAAGKPIALVLSRDDPTPVFLVAGAVFKDAPHPNAAKLFLNWYLAPEQQSRTGTFSARSDVSPPAGWQALSSYNLDRGFRALLSDESAHTALKKRFEGYTTPR